MAGPQGLTELQTPRFRSSQSNVTVFTYTGANTHIDCAVDHLGEDTVISWVRRRDLQGLNLRVTHVSQLWEFERKRLDVLGADMNFTYSLIHSRSYGTVLEDGTTSGMVKLIAEGSAHMTGSTMFKTKERAGVMSFAQ